jgi:hypothetical protein
MIVVPAKTDEKENATMAEARSLTTREAAEGVLASEHADVLRESVAVLVREIMELEVAKLAGAEHGERAPGPQVCAAERISRPAVGHARGRDRAADPEAPHEQLSA